MKTLRRAVLFLLITALLFASAFTARAAEDAPSVEAGIADISKYGNITLSVRPDALSALGFEPGDLVLVTIGGAEMEMPIGTSYSDVDYGEAICCIKTVSDGSRVVVLAINNGNLASAMGISKDDGADTPVKLTMAEKQGYAEGYRMHQLTGSRSNNRADYPQLSDAEYANFRVIETVGMGKGALYRSSSPVNPALNRNKEADEALFQARIRTVLNLADSEEGMRQYADFALSHCAACDIAALDMGVDFMQADYRQKLAEGLRFIIAHEGPYLIHCNEGKERTGFAAALLECLMGADADEVVGDYMLSYYNFYGIGPESPQYAQVAHSNIENILAGAFGLASFRDESADLRSCAEGYLAQIGLSGDEIAQLRARLAADDGGLSAG